ncbi:MAG: MFS transporter [Xanthobacteraceae bacterium]
MKRENRHRGHMGDDMESDLGLRTLAKVSRRLIPFAMLLFILSYLDRVNVSFAALQMNHDLGFTPTVYGLGAGIFFLGFFPFEIPSNLVLERVGARLWIARITIVWGIVATATAWISGAKSFYAMRFLLGVAEAGFLPGIILYFSYWFPAKERAKALGLFMASTAIANIIGAPLSTSLLTLDGWLGLRGWQLLFITEGIPSILVGFWVLYYMTERPQDATWLATAERDWLIRTLAAERKVKEAMTPTTLWRGLTDGRVLMITALCFFLVSGNFGVVFWLPQIIKSFGGLTNIEVGGLAALPYLLAVVVMVWWGRRSDRRQERKWHLATAAFIGSLGLAASAVAPNPMLSFIALCVATVGIWSMFGVFWAIPSDFLSGTAAAGGFALINSFGTLGGFAGPFLVGFVRSATGSFSASLLVLAAFVMVAAVLAALLKDERDRLRSAPA